MIDADLAGLLASPSLKELTQQAFAANADLAIADARLDQARAFIRPAKLARLPSVDLAAGASKRFALNSGALDFRDTFASLDLYLDLDLFGALSAAQRAAVARGSAAQLQRDAVRLAVESELAAIFVQRAALASRLAILDRSIARAAELERIVKVRFSEGEATRVDLGLQTVRLLDLRRERSELVGALDQTRTGLALVLGAEAPGFDSANVDPESLVVPTIATPAPALMLAARPDVQASEALIAAAGGDVGQARARFYPSLGISLSGLLSGSAGSPLAASLTTGSSLLAPIFSRGKIEAQYRYATAVQLEAVETYRKTILSALAETENLRAIVRQADERSGLVMLVLDEARTTARIANIRYIEGEEDFQSVLDAEQWLNYAEEAKVLNWQERMLAQISLYRAIGGHGRTQ